MDASKYVTSDARNRPKPFTFRPPKLNKFVTRFIALFLPRLLRKKMDVVKIEIEPGSLERLRKLKGKRCLLMPSHSGGFEPYVIMHLARLLDDYYYYVAAIEAFEESPVIGWIMQRLGAYSIIRGASDRLSFQMTKKIMVEGKKWLVIFPEGQTVWQNDTVIPFQPGVIQLAFKAFEDVVKKDENASYYCVPISIRYVYMKDMEQEIYESLKRLEVGLFPSDYSPPENKLKRLRHISEAVVIANEKKHNVTPEPDVGLDVRIQHMKEVVVSEIEQKLSVIPRKGQNLLDRIRVLFNTVDRVTQEEPEGMSEYELRLWMEHQEVARDLYDDLWRVLQLIAIYGEYVRESVTESRFLDVLCLLEKEVFGVRRTWGPRTARVKVGEPVDLKDHFEDYKTDKRKATQKLTEFLEDTVRQMLRSLAINKQFPSEE